jgi:predicted transcriptional regulator
MKALALRMQKENLENIHRKHFWKLKKGLEGKRNLTIRRLLGKGMTKRESFILLNLINHEQYLISEGKILAGEEFYHLQEEIKRQETQSNRPISINKAGKTLAKLAVKEFINRRREGDNKKGNKFYYQIKFSKVNELLLNTNTPEIKSWGKELFPSINQHEGVL